MSEDDYKIAYEIVLEANKMYYKEIERLQNIIKEVREYIEEKYEVILKDSTKDFLDHDEKIERKRILHILEILDKENKE